MTQRKISKKKNRKLKLVKLEGDIKKGRVLVGRIGRYERKRDGWKTHQNRAKRVLKKIKVKVC